MIMGSWQLEVGKMFLYVMIPVAAFHFFNKPEMFQEWLTSTRLETYPAVDPSSSEKFRQSKLECQKAIREKKAMLLRNS